MKIIWILLVSFFELSSFPQNLNYTFYFGKGKNKPGYIVVDTNNKYNATNGYGFDYNTLPLFENRQSIKKSYCTSNTSFYFSVKVPEGHYNVTIALGNEESESITTVKAESRRLMLEGVKTKPGEIITRTFTVNVRTPKINDTLSIKLKPREHSYLNWDDKLTLEFTDKHPCIRSIQIEKIEPELVIYLAGNSTVTDQSAEPWASWGQMITRFIKPGVSVANYAESGESLTSFYKSNRLEKILNMIKPGDYLFIEFGHNDQKLSGEGIGPWLTYSDYLRLYIDKAQQKGAIPVLVTSMHRRKFDENGKIVFTLGDFPAAMRAVAKEKGVPLIDLNNMSQTLYETWGIEDSKKAFVHYPANTYPNQSQPLEDNTHFSNYGAYNIALCILKGILDNSIDLNQYIVDFPESFDPSRPIPLSKWNFPESTPATNEIPEGS